MTRKEVYAQIKKLNLEEAVKRAFGRNFTQCTTVLLVDFVNKATAPKKKKTCNCADSTYSGKSKQKTIEAVVGDLISVLCDKRILLHSEVDKILFK